jgi:hypothetical protein
MLERVKWKNTKEIMDLSWDVKEVRFDYKDLLLAWLLWFNLDDPGELVENLTNYRKIH